MAAVEAPGVSSPSSLEQARIHALPACAYYIPNFISEEEETVILEKVRRRYKVISRRPFVSPTKSSMAI